MYPIHIITQEKRDLITNEIQKWNSLEQTALIVENLKLLSFNLVKLVASYCSDLIEQKQLYHNITSSMSPSSTPTSPTSSGAVNFSHFLLLGANNGKSNTDSLEYFTILEEQANEPSYFHVLKDKPIETRLKLLISYLPLLKSDPMIRSKLRPIYYDFINDIFNQSIKTVLSLFDCYQLALLASMHPIFDYKQRAYFKKWLTLFEMKIVNENKTELLNSNQLTSSLANSAGAASNGGLFVGFVGQQSPSKELFAVSTAAPAAPQPPSNQLLFNPASSASLLNNFTDTNNTSLLDISAQQELNNLGSLNTFSDLINELNSCSTSSTTSSGSSGRPIADLKSSFSFPSALSSLNSLTNQANENSFLSNNFDQLLNNDGLNKYCEFQLDHPLMSSMTSGASSPHIMSNFDNERALVTNHNDGMENVYHWLKSLRLHKYALHFATLTYDQMLKLNDDQLISLNITLGARKKILANIEKIKKRRERLEEIKKLFETNESLTVFSLLEILNELYELAIGPMKSQNKSPTSVNYLTDLHSPTSGNGLIVGSRQDTNETVVVTKLFVEILEISQKHIIKHYVTANQEQREDLGETVHDLIVIYLRTIDKLFLTKGFADIQQAQLSKMRNHLCEKTQTFKIDSSKKITKKKMLVNFSSNGADSKQVANSGDNRNQVSYISNWPARRASAVGALSQNNTPPPPINRPTLDRTMSSPFGNRTFNYSSVNNGSTLNNNRSNIFQPYQHFQRDDNQINYDSKN